MVLQNCHQFANVKNTGAEHDTNLSGAKLRAFNDAVCVFVIEWLLNSVCIEMTKPFIGLLAKCLIQLLD